MASCFFLYICKYPINTSMKKHLLLTSILLWSVSLFAQNAWINEIHYDNPGTDEDEFIEIVIEDIASWTLGDFTISLYNGSDGETYSTISLDQYTAGEIIDGFSIYHYNYTANGFSIQNGDPDGMALAYQGALIPGQFISYEGTFVATNGPAIGETSSDIGVAEPGEIGESLQLSGNGTLYEHFEWESPAVATAGFANNAQTFGTIAPEPEPDNHVTGFIASEKTWYSINLIWTDASGENLPAGYLIKYSTTGVISEPVDGIHEDDNDSIQNIAFGLEETVFYNLEPGLNHYFKIWPYSNDGTDINYKLNGEVPLVNDTTFGEPDFINHEKFETGTFGTWSSWSAASDKDWIVSNAMPGAIGTEWSAQMNGYQENEPSNDWLISPLLELGNYNNEKICFFTQWKYGNSMEEMMLKYSMDYSGGDPTSATWVNIDFTKPQTDEIWAFSDSINLSAITNSDVYLAFHYLSSDSPRRWSVDEIQITGDEIQEIIVLTPQNGDEWITENSYDITWNNTPSTTVVDILYTLDASNPEPTWFIIEENIPAATESFTWNIPDDQPVSSDYQIKIEDQNNPVTGYSGIFSISNPPYVPALVINEIMYNPPESIGADDYFEFIEIYNNDPEAVNLLNFTLSGDVQYAFTDDITLQPGDYIVIASHPDSLEFYYGIADVLGPYSGLLSNSGGTITLSNSTQTVDEVNYDVSQPWPEEPNGTGFSLELLAASLDNSIPENWGTAYIIGGTPGEVNSLITEVSGIVISEIFYNPPGENNEALEYIEVYNSNNEDVNLGGCHFTKGIDFVFPAVTLGSGDYLVITRNLNMFVGTFGLPAYEWQAGELENTTDTLEIQDNLGNIIDYVPYNSEQPWDTLAAGHGPSLELVAPNVNNELPENWFASTTYNTILNGVDSIWCTPYDGFSVDPPTADFIADTTTIYVSQYVVFTALVSGNPDHYAWSFPGGTPDTCSNEVIPHISYHIPGTYDVSLYVSNIYGEDTETKQGYITVIPMPDPPIADFEADNRTVYVGESINYFDLTLNNPDAWDWHFYKGDPLNSTNQNPQDIKYILPGRFDVTLSASNIAGEDIITKEDYITVLDTTPHNLIITEIMYNPPETDTDTLEFIELYNAENNTVMLEGYYFSGIDFTFPQYEFEQGEYILIASNPDAIMNAFGVQAFGFDGGFLDNNGELIELYTPNGTLVDHVEYDDEAPWPTAADGNGPSLVLCDMQLNNSLPGSWTSSVDFAAVNANNDTIWASPGAPCGNVPAPVAAFTAEPGSGAPGLIVAFTDRSINNPQSWSWEFPGGTPQTSQEQNPIIQYQQAGDFDVTLTVQNHWGAHSHTETSFIHVSVGINAYESTQILVTPNPSSTGIFKIMTSDSYKWEYSIHTMTGALVEKNNFHQKQHNIDLMHLEDGIYLLILKNSNNFIQYFKLIKN